ncbi:complex I subunit 5 family protein [Chelatococcus asaccharovorans]|uniref:complex I subunit 5 family protein n=1 Tax=Chelatococcus asaccharovorans TaxID=28210 RepID=UPI00224C6CB7|nr:proton-conducting transporter membrane subunit [Chelatococcus asaccharovorans]CAH1659190.1 Formate hydrogenlyase subunit 3/multisubunit Na+/H+ antiporter MnhD subunit [Chelatococcus asaccharovorans]CAH1688111.1 Formate hydrogenlyase subunit 3/multisubunit Na+/H+ antiporter MnhD subunit [Chelatococcus asaccharovorans]
MSIQGLLLPASILLPLAMALFCLSRNFRAKVPFLIVIAPLPALLAAVFAPDGTVVFFPPPFRLSLVLDRPGAILLGGAALLWSAAGAYTASYMGREPSAPRFAVWWLLTLAGSLGLFIVGDVANFYLLFTLASLAAFGLIVHEQTERAHRASRVYVVLALLGEAFLLLAFVMLAASHPDANPLIRDVVATLPASPMRNGIVALLVLGFALKMGLVPLHVWLPLAHPAAPMPASAVLSGVVVKAGVIGLIRFLPFDAGLPFWGPVLMTLGLITAYYGVAVGITQTRAKTILAYSTVSQMGLIAVLLGVGLATADAGSTNLVAYYAVHHTLVKGALFLAVGILAATGGPRLRPVFLLTAILALSLGGMPLTSGALAKLATKPMLGYGFLSLAMALAGAGSTLLMLHFLITVAGDMKRDPGSRAPLGQIGPWLVVALASLVIPWSLYPGLTGEPLTSLLTPEALWKVTWPMLLGGVAMLIVRRLPWLSGSIPEGDIVVLAEAGEPAVRRVVTGITLADDHLRRWSTAGLWLIGLVVLFGATLMLQN